MIKSNIIFHLVLSILALYSIDSFGQAADDYRSAGSGDWNVNGTWQRYNGTTWVAATTTPTSANGVITIQAGHTVTVPGGFSVTVDEFNMSGGSALIVASNGEINVNDNLTLSTGGGFPPTPASTITINSNGTFIIGGTLTNATTANFTVNGIYEHNLNGGSIPIVNWNTGSTCRVTGVTINAPTGLNQTFYNFTWNCPSQNDFPFISSLRNITNDLNLTSAGVGGVALSNTETNTLTVGNDLNISSGAFYLNTFGNGFTINVGNNFTNSSNATFATISGTTTINITGDFINNGNFRYNDGSNSSGLATISIDGDFNNTGTITQGNATSNIDLSGTGSINYTNSGTFTGSINLTILNGTTVNMASSVFTGTGTFEIENNSTLQLANTDPGGAVNFALANTGTKTFNTGSTIEYNGSTLQYLGSGHSANANALINNANNVALAGNASVRDLTLTSGNLQMTNQTLTINGAISGTGNITPTANSDITIAGLGAAGTLNLGANTLNNFILNRTSSGSVILGNDLTVNGALTLTAGSLNFSDRSLTVGGGITSTTGLLQPNANSSLTIQGTTPSEDLQFVSGSSIGTLEINKLGTVNLISNPLTVQDSLNLVAGTLNINASLAPAAGSVINRTNGTLTSGGGLLEPVGPFNLVYNATATTGFEVPDNATDLLDLTIASGTVTLADNVTVNGDLTLTGSLNAGTNTISLNGTGTYNRNGGSLVASANTVSVDGTYSITGTGTPSFNNLVINGALTGYTGTVNIAANFTNNGTYTANGGTVNFTGTTLINGTSTTTFNNLAFAGTSNVTLPASMSVDGNFTATTGAVIAPGTGTLSFTGSTQQTITPGGTSLNNVVMSGAGTKLLAGTFDVNGNLTNSSTLDVSVSNHTINLAGDWNNTGTFNARNGTVILDATGDPQTLSGTTTFYNLTYNNTFGNPSGVSGTVNIQNTFTMGANSNFDADGSGAGVFTLRSIADNGTGDARIATIPSTATLSGNITVQRFMSGEGRFYRYIGSPVSGAAVSDLQNEIAVIGDFTGATPGGVFQNMYDYDAATQTWTEFPVSSNTETFTPGRGYSIFVDEGASNVTFDLRGPVTTGDFSWSGLAYTNDANTDNDWNLVANPYPSTVDFPSVVRSDVANAFYVPDRATGQIRSWVNGTATNGQGTNTDEIAMYQAFWIRTTGSSPSMSITEAGKSSDGRIFYRENTAPQLVRLSLSDGLKSDETVVILDSMATEGLDNDKDAIKYNNQIFNLFSKSADQRYAINSLPLDCQRNIPIDISNAGAGNYSITFSDLETVTDPVSVQFYDAITDSTFAVENALSYAFSITSDSATFHNRFTLQLSTTTLKQNVGALIPAVCEDEDVTIELTEPQQGIRYTLFNARFISDTLDISTGTSFTIPSAELLGARDTFYVAVNATNGCIQTTLNSPVVITRNLIPALTNIQAADLCGSGDGLVTAASADASVYRLLDNAGTILEENSTGTFSIPSISRDSSFMVQALSAAGCINDPQSVAVVVNEVPIMASLKDTLLCGSDVTSITFGELGTDKILRYDQATGGIPVDTIDTSTLELNNITTDQILYFSRLSSTGCESASREAVSIQVGTTPQIQLANAIENCGPGSIDLNVKTSGASEIRWIGNESSFDPTDDFIFNFDRDTTFQLQALSAAGCESTVETVNIVINPVPAITSVTETSRCGEGDVTVQIASESTAQYLYNGDTLTATGSLTIPLQAGITEQVITPLSSSGCTGAPFTFETTANSIPSFTSIVADDRCGPGEITITFDALNANQFTLLDESGNELSSTTGDTLTAFIEEETSFTIQAVNANNCVAMSELITVQTIEAPSISSVPSATICEGDQAELSIEQTDNNYFWYSSDTAGLATGNTFLTNSLSVTTSYLVRPVSPEGCLGSFYLSEVTVNPRTNVTQTDQIELCFPEPVVLNASGGAEGDTYLWYTSEGDLIEENTSGTLQINPDISTAYLVEILNSYGCRSFERADAGVTIFNPDTPFIEQDGLVLVSSYTAGNQWYLNDEPIEGATSQRFEPQAPGDYLVEITTLDGCMVKSAPVSFRFTSLSGNNGVAIYPNPVQDMLNISTTNGQVINSYEIYNTEGKLVDYNQNYNQRSGIGVSSLIPGKYTIILVGENDQYTISFIKR